MNTLSVNWVFCTFGLDFALAAYPYLPLLDRCPHPPLEELTLCQYFASSVCKSFCLGSKIYQIYHVIILLYRPHFNFALVIKIVPYNTIESIYTEEMFIFDIMSEVCNLLFHKTQKFDGVINFYPFLEKKWIYTEGVEKLT